ncbi:hypothetical protein Pmani_026621 [Petrolisthes manimaculis]|uniref:Uncharacterized protein n=1 Tax=Petrolisthes manimaculis TaxID=1843537 RepID=A0AAE1P320_9EUCA|nr:hypothetical protein Pmani_026621 [Petrolisthes manimaculis]
MRTHHRKSLRFISTSRVGDGELPRTKLAHIDRISGYLPCAPSSELPTTPLCDVISTAGTSSPSSPNAVYDHIYKGNQAVTSQAST